MPDNEQQSGPPALRPPTEPLDPEQVRQFQQFQQFQELMRQQGGGLLPPPAKPLWKKVLGSRLVRRLALVLVVLLGLYFAYDYYFGDDNENLPASMTGGGTTDNTTLLEKAPKRTVRQVYSHIAQSDADAGRTQPPYQYEFVCGQFKDGAEKTFARNFGTPDCKAAVAKLFAEIDKSRPGWRNAYADPFPTVELGEVPPGRTAVVSSCALHVQPRLGEFTLERIANDQWAIVGHRLENC